MEKTINPGKQRKRLYNIIYHNKRKILTAPLDKRLFASVGKKRIPVRKGDTVKIMIGDNKGKTGKVDKVDYTKERIYIKDIKRSNNRGQEKLIPFVASNLLVTDLVLTDVKRISKKQKSIKTPINKKVE